MKMDSREGAGDKHNVSYREAFNIIGANIWPSGNEELALGMCVGRIAAEDLIARIDYPAADISLKDGFAVKSRDVIDAGSKNPVKLKVTGIAQAGVNTECALKEGGAVKIYPGAIIPEGANAVVAGEFCQEMPGGEVMIKAHAADGKNILRAGDEVEVGEVIIRKGERLLPGYLGMAAAAGINHVKVFTRPHVALIGVGDEVVALGNKLKAGQAYAGSLVTMEAWLAQFNISCVTSVVPDDNEAIKQELKKYFGKVDAIITSGGAWESDRDLVIGVLNQMGWQELLHHVRMDPGKGIIFGVWEHKPVFCLPGGPSDNEMAFIQLALPALLRIAGETRHPLQTVPARLSEEVRGRNKHWTEFKDAVVTIEGNGCYRAGFYKNRSRLQVIARAGGLICKPEGKDVLRAGEIVPVQLLAPRLDDL